MAAGTVRVRGLDGLVRDFRKMSPELRRDLQRRLSDVAKPIAREASGIVARWDGRSAAGIRPRVRGGSAFVEQRRRKVTGLRGDYGALQMRQALVPSLMRNQSAIEKGLEDMLDDLADSNGF